MLLKTLIKTYQKQNIKCIYIYSSRHKNNNYSLICILYFKSMNLKSLISQIKNYSKEILNSLTSQIKNYSIEILNLEILNFTDQELFNRNFKIRNP
jgi:hypothetical protein